MTYITKKRKLRSTMEAEAAAGGGGDTNNTAASSASTRRSPRRRAASSASGVSAASTSGASASAVSAASASGPVAKHDPAAEKEKAASTKLALVPEEEAAAEPAAAAAPNNINASANSKDDDTKDTPSLLPPKKRTRAQSMASITTNGSAGNESAGPTVAGPIVEVLDPEMIDSIMPSGDGVGGGNAAAAAASSSASATAGLDQTFPVPTGSGGRSRMFSMDFLSHMAPPSISGPHDQHHGAHESSSSAAHHPGGPPSDPVDTLIGTAVDALLGCRPRSMSQESIGSLGLRSRSNTLDLMAGANVLSGSSSDLLALGAGRRSRSNTLEFLSGVALGEGVAGIGNVSVGAGSGTSTGGGGGDGVVGSGNHRKAHHSSRKDSISDHNPASPSRRKTSTGTASESRRTSGAGARKPDNITSALDHLDALGETKSPASAAAAASGSNDKDAAAESGADGKNRKNSDHSHDTLDSHHQKLLYEALISGGGASGVGSGGRERADTTDSWTALIASTARERADSWGGMSDISFGAAAGHADIVAEITANALHHTGLADDVANAVADIGHEDAAGGLALVQLATPPTSSQASLASGSTGAGAGAGAGGGQKQRAQKTGAGASSKSLSIPKKISVKAKGSTAKGSAGKKSARPAAAAKRKESASSASTGPRTQSLSVHFPKNMPHGAAAAAAKAAAEAATAAGASPAELSAIVAAAMATVSKQLFNITGDVKKALVSTEKGGGKTPPGMKKVNIEYTSEAGTKAKPMPVKAKPKLKPKAKKVAKPANCSAPAPSVSKLVAAAKAPARPAVGRKAKMAKKSAPKEPAAQVKHAPTANIVAASGSSGSSFTPKGKGSQPATAAPAVAKVPKPPVDMKRLPPRKRTDGGFALFDLPMELPQPLPDVPPIAAAPIAAASPSSNTPPISVDYDAVAAAVDAANSATIPMHPGALVTAIVPSVRAAAETPTLVPGSSVVAAKANAKQESKAIGSRTGTQSASHCISAVGDVKPSNNPTSTTEKVMPKTPLPRPPLKKRTKRPTPEKSPLNNTPRTQGGQPPLSTPSFVAQKPLVASSAMSTPSIVAQKSLAASKAGLQNLTTPNVAPSRPMQPTPASVASATTVGSRSSLGTPGTTASFSSSNNQSNQKWDEMFDALVEYVEEQQAKHADSLRAGRECKWDGNVPTTYKTKDGKALGRWINNQRSAKTKGSLKREREERLLSTGLKWSVLSTNAWPEMLRELRRYVDEKEARGETWDGNVPTNYRIRARDNGSEYDEDKNLGRWINRQRSLYQAGKLKKERQEELERIGLRWSVLSTTSWDVMFEALLEYAQERRQEDPHSGWDGNVPANYKTDENPPKSLGRWVNRQRSAYAKNKLKQEFVTKLERAGLKWSVHERRDARSRSPKPDIEGRTFMDYGN